MSLVVVSYLTSGTVQSDASWHRIDLQMGDQTFTAREREWSLGACRLVELSQRRSGEVVFFSACPDGICCLYTKGYMASLPFPCNGVCSPGVYFNPAPYSGDFRLECSYWFHIVEFLIVEFSWSFCTPLLCVSVEYTIFQKNSRWLPHLHTMELT